MNKKAVVIVMLSITLAGCGRQLSESGIKAMLYSAYEKIESEDYKDSIYMYKTVLRSDKQNQEALLNTAYAYFQLGSYKKALNFYDKTLKDYPRNEMAILGKAYCYRQLNNNEMAIKTLRDSLLLIEDSPILYEQLAKFYLMSKKVKKAEHLLSLAIKKFNDDVNMYILMSVTKTYEGRLNEAYSYAKKAEKMDPKNRKVKSLLNIFDKIKNKPVKNYWDYSEEENEEFNSIMKSLMSDSSGRFVR